MQVLDGFNVYGYLTSNVGLGVAARNTIQMLLANDVPVAPIDINPGGGGIDSTYTELIAENNGAAPLRREPLPPEPRSAALHDLAVRPQPRPRESPQRLRPILGSPTVAARLAQDARGDGRHPRAVVVRARRRVGRPA